jgi:hypothetical protein
MENQDGADTGLVADPMWAMGLMTFVLLQLDASLLSRKAKKKNENS